MLKCTIELFWNAFGNYKPNINHIAQGDEFAGQNLNLALDILQHGTENSRCFKRPLSTWDTHRNCTTEIHSKTDQNGTSDQKTMTKYHKCMQTLKEASQKDSGHQPLSSEPAHQSRLSWFSRLVGCFYLSALCSWPTQTRSPFLVIFWGWKPSRWISEGRCHHEVLDEQKHLRPEQRSISTVSSPVWVLRRKLYFYWYSVNSYIMLYIKSYSGVAALWCSCRKHSARILLAFHVRKLASLLLAEAASHGFTKPRSAGYGSLVVILSYYSKLVGPQMRCELHLGSFPHKMLSLTRVNTASRTVWSKASLRITSSDQPIHHPPGFLQIYRRFAPQQKGRASKWQHHVQVFCEGSGVQENPRVSWIRMANVTYSKLGGWFIHSQKLHF